LLTGAAVVGWRLTRDEIAHPLDAGQAALPDHVEAG
jgi:hypothetical protein